MSSITKKENNEMSGLYDNIYNERMSQIQIESEKQPAGDKISTAANLKNEVEKMRDGDQEIPPELEAAEREADKEISDTVKQLKTDQ